jgi:ribosomal protein S18 acetylase RimI-like enzyme
MPHSIHNIDRIVDRHERFLQRMFQREDLEPKKHKYYLMEIEPEKVKEILNEFKSKEQKFSKLMNLVKVRPYNWEDEKDQKMFTELFNLVLLSSPDPFRPLTQEEAAKYFKEGTFLAFLYGKCVGYGVLTIEKTDQGKIGVIAGIGVHPKHRRKNIALKLALEMAQWFLDKGDLVKLQCEVYERNEVSYKFITSFGFKKVGEFYLD